MNKHTDLLTALTQLRDLIQSGNPPIEHGGICSWLKRNAVIQTLVDFIDLCHEWPKCRVSTHGEGNSWKSYTFPIVNSDQYVLEAENGTQWSNPTRLEFIDWAIDYLSK